MAIKRQNFFMQGGLVIDTIEYHDGKYGAPGKQRQKKKEVTQDDIRKINQLNKTRRCRLRLLKYFNSGDCFATWTYAIPNRPPTMAEAKKHFKKAMRYVRKEYKKGDVELRWIRNIERGTKGAWHIHLVIKENGNTASILKAAWEHGGTYTVEIRHNDKVYDEDFTKLAAYMTKDEYTEYENADGQKGKPRIKESSYSTSRNMTLPKARTKMLKRWKEFPKARKGYYIIRIHEGINPKTGFKYRRYTEIRLNRRI